MLVARVDQDSRVYDNGLRAGDIITAVNNRWQVTNLEKLSEIIRQTQGTFALNVVRDNRRLFLVIQ
jgi:S1-C subfamily serine protease